MGIHFLLLRTRRTHIRVVIPTEFGGAAYGTEPYRPRTNVLVLVIVAHDSAIGGQSAALICAILLIMCLGGELGVASLVLTN